MFGIVSPTPYDLNFRLLGIPVRVNPFFWALAAVLGWSGRKGPEILVWVACVFLSILVHEFGHGLTARRAFRQRPTVVLYYMGGLCYYDDDQRHPWRRALVLIMGPGAGFLLFGLVLGLGLLVLGAGGFRGFGLFQVHDTPSWFNHLPEWVNHLAQEAFSDLLFINLFWGLFNLLPIFPLDGGQLAQVFLTMHNRRQGAVRTYVLSMVTAGLLAVCLFTLHDNFNALFIACFAFLNFQLFQAARYQSNSLSRFETDDDWWRR
jgi:stage IV sporulation protein FB